MFFPIFTILNLFSGLIPQTNSYNAHVRTIIYDDHESTPVNSLNAYFFKLDEFTLPEGFENEKFELAMTITNSSTKKTVYEKYYPEETTDEYKLKKEMGNAFIILQSQEGLEITFQFQVKDITDSITIQFPEPDKNMPMKLTTTTSGISFCLSVASVQYFDRLGQVNLLSGNGYFYTKVPLDKRFYCFITLKDNISLVTDGSALSEYQQFPPFLGAGFNATQTFYELTVTKVGYDNSEDQLESCEFQFDFYMKLHNKKVKIGSRTVELSKKEYTQSELNLNDFKMPIDLSIPYSPEMEIIVTQNIPNGRIATFELNSTELFGLKGQSEVTFTENVMGISFTTKLTSITSTYVCFNPKNIRKYNNVSVLTTVDIIEVNSKSGFIEFHIGKGDKYKLIGIVCTNESYLGLNFYTLFKGMRIIHYTTGSGVEIIASSKPGDISIIEWNNEEMIIYLERDSTDDKDYRVQYVFGNDQDKDIKIFEEEENKKKNKINKYIYLALIIVGVISVLISLYCIGRKCSKRCGGGDSSSGLL